MIGIVVVSHSALLAEAAVSLALEVAPPGARPIVLAAGGVDGGLGTDAAAIAAALGEADSGDGVLVLVDLGSAVLSAEMACEFIDPDAAARVRISPAPLVEGLVAATVAAAIGGDLATCDAEARRGCEAKGEHLGAGSAEVDAGQATTSGARVLELRIDLPHGLHARPAAAIASALAPFDAQVTLRNVTRGGDSTEADSPMGILALGVRQGDVVEATVDGPDADAAAAALQALADEKFGES